MNRMGGLFFFCLLLASVCAAQTRTIFTIDTVAGGAVYDGLPALATPLNSPAGLWMDGAGALWVVDTGNHVIRRLDPASGIITVVAGGGTVLDDSVPTPGATVQLQRPTFITGDAAGNIYFSDTGNNRVRRLTPDGQVSTIAGTGQAAFSGDGGPARLARLNAPAGLALDSSGNLFIADAGNCRIRRIDAAGNISTYAGTGACGFPPDGSLARDAAITPQGLAFDRNGNLHFTGGNLIRRIERDSGRLSTVAGLPDRNSCGQIYEGGPVATTPICNTHTLVFGPDGNLYFSQQGPLARLDLSSGMLFSLGADATGVVLDASGNVVFTQISTGLVQRVPGTGGNRTVVAGTTDVLDGPARLAVLPDPHALAVDAAGNTYVVSVGRVRRFDASTGQVTTVVGGGSLSIADGAAGIAVRSYGASGLAVDPQGNLVLTTASALWRLNMRTGLLARLAGQAEQPPRFTPDGVLARDALLDNPGPVAVDAAGNIFFHEFGSYRVRRVDAATGILTTVAGNGTAGTPGDGVQATSTPLGAFVQAIGFDGQGQLLILDAHNSGNAVRRVNLTTRTISTLQVRFQSGDTLRPASFPAQSVAADRDGNIFLADRVSIRQIRASDSLITDIVRSTDGFFGDGGPASLARASLQYRHPANILGVDGAGSLYFSDVGNGRLRKISQTVVQAELGISPANMFFTRQQGSAVISAQQLSITSPNGASFNWTTAVATSAGGDWLRVSAASGTVPATVLVSVDASRLGAGTYQGTVTVQAPGVRFAPQVVEVVLTVSGVAGAVLGLSQQFLNFQAAQGGANPTAQTISITNTGSGTLNWSASAETSSGGNWLRISPNVGTAPSTLAVSADIANLPQGTYQGQVQVRSFAGGEPRVISVVLTVSRAQPILLATQTGFLFVGVEGSLVIGPQSFGIQNAGQGRLDWQVGVNLPAGGEWLRVTPLSGSSEAGQPAPPITLSLDPSRLRAGIHVALLTMTAPGALNAPQTAIVLVNMLPRGSLPVGTINPLGLIFTAQAGSSGALARGITIATTGGQPLQFLARARTQSGGNWLSVTPEQGALLSSSENANLSVQANPAGLSAGVYFGGITLTFGTGITQEVAVALVVASTTTAIRAPGAAVSTLAACTPRRLVIVETKVGNRFNVLVGWPVPLLAQVVDDCGTSVTNATVTAAFTGTDPPVVFQNLRDGTYAATWVPGNAGSIGVTVRGVSPSLEDGATQFSGTIGTAAAGSTRLPLLFPFGWVNAASFDRFKPLAPGMIFSLFGSNLAEGQNLAGEVPLPRQLGNLRASLGGIELPLFYADGSQINAQVPFEIPAGTASLVVTGRGAAGAPGQVTIVAAQPGIFTMSQTGTGQGLVFDAQNRLVDANNPVTAGDAVVVYATGLGATDPPVGTGTATPLSPLSHVTTQVVATVGGRPATVEFAGLVPRFVGLYQVNVRVPAGVAPGNAVPLVLSQNGVAGNTVTMAVR